MDAETSGGILEGRWLIGCRWYCIGLCYLYDIRINLTFHSSAQAFGKIMSIVKPRHAVAYHFFNDEDTRYEVYDGMSILGEEAEEDSKNGGKGL